MKFLSLLVSGMLMLALVGCKEQTFHLGIKFTQVPGLEKGDRVLVQDKKVGEVSNISSSSRGDFLVGISISEKLKGLITDRAGFYLIEDPEREGKKAISIRLVEGGSPLKEGSQVNGEITASAVQDLFDDLERGFDELATQLKGFVENLQKIPESEEYKRLKREMERLAQEMKEAGEEAREKLHKEIIPKLQKELDKLKEELRKLGKERDAEPLEEELDRLKRI